MPIFLRISFRIARILDVIKSSQGSYPAESKAFAVADHQLAHIYVANQADIPFVQNTLDAVPGVAAVVAPVC